ncbi:hypothetical protein GY45DRAFT_278668 [Cubamyces sp. BRFM 1775]|nr:hypothetical protein GY45DRAFT_278668 [Cubamyces sp. BRFM 1775]
MTTRGATFGLLEVGWRRDANRPEAARVLTLSMSTAEAISRRTLQVMKLNKDWH